MRLKRIAVGVDFVDPSPRIARWTVQRFAPDAEHLLVHAVDLRSPPAYLAEGGVPDADVEGARAKAAGRLEDVAAEIGGTTRTEVRAGRPDEAVSDAAEDANADLIVVGRGGNRGVLGGTAERLVNTAAVPILMVPDDPPGEVTRILAAIDDSPQTGEVLDWAHGLAERHGAHLTVVHVFRPTFAGVGELVSGGTSREEIEDEQRSAARSWLENTARDAGLDPSRITLEIREGDPAPEILSDEHGPPPDLVVTGSRGPGAIRKALLGSVASRVLRSAPGPVLVVGRS